MTFVQNAFGENAPRNASAFQKLDHDFYNGSLSGLLAMAKSGRIFNKNKNTTPISAIVRDFQQALKTKGFYAGLLDGNYGKGTADAVTAFQGSVGLTATGIIDESTWKLLL